MQGDRLRRIPAVVLVLLGLAIVVWSGAAIYGEVASSQDQHSYDATEAEQLDSRIYEFEELSPEAQNLTVVALHDEIPTRSPVPPEFASNESNEDARDTPDQIEDVVEYHIRYRGEFHLLGVSTNDSAVTVVEISRGPDEDFYAYSSLTDRERDVVDRAIDCDSTIHGPDTAEFPHFGAEPKEEGGTYVVYKDGQAYELAVQKRGTGLRLWPLILVPAFLLGVAAVTIGAIGYWLSATAAPTAVLAGLTTLFGPPLLTELGVIAPLEAPIHLLGIAPLVTGLTLFGFEILRALGRYFE